jgi:secondary thiamine-phosphate synthase enzyme
MEIFKVVVDLKTSNRVEIRDITPEIQDVLKKSQIENGLINVFSRHSTSGIVINENESGLVQDFQNMLEKLVPTAAGYRHDRIDNNADSHLRSFIIGSSQSIPIENGSLALGTWQSIFFVELDGPRNRKITVTILGEY